MSTSLVSQSDILDLLNALRDPAETLRTALERAPQRTDLQEATAVIQTCERTISEALSTQATAKATPTPPGQVSPFFQPAQEAKTITPPEGSLKGHLRK